jgi:hypothetical protein
MMPPRPLNHPARVLTLDQAYGRAYARLRTSVLSFCEAEPDMQRRSQLLSALDDVEYQCESDMLSLFLGEHLARSLARPE